MLEIILKGQERMLAKVNKLKNQIEQLSNLINLLEVSEVEAEILYILGQDQLFEIVDEGVSNIKLSEIFKNTYKRTRIDKVTKELEIKGFVTKVKSNPIVYKMNSELLKDIVD